MRTVVILSVLYAALIAAQKEVLADDKPEQFCMESADGGGGTTVRCTFETMAQCMASKSSPADQCFPNPRLSNRR